MEHLIRGPMLVSLDGLHSTFCAPSCAQALLHEYDALLHVNAALRAQFERPGLRDGDDTECINEITK
jgi:hypothetical protein